MKTLVNKNNPQIRITAPEIEAQEEAEMYLIPVSDYCIPMCIDDWTLVEEEPEMELENYISNKLRELGADLINHKPYSFNRGLNVGEGNAYQDILDRLKARKEVRYEYRRT